MIYLFEQDKLENWAYWDNLFTPNECLQIINIGNSLSKNQGSVSDSNPYNLEIRESNVSWISYNENTKWIFDRLAGALINLNDNFFKFDLYGFTENLQFTEYKAPTGHYVKHIDRGAALHPRKLSMVLQLSDPADYEGGDLELHYQHNPIIAPKDIGKLIVFPSFTLHGVTPITKGIRYSLVAWLSGPKFK
jgi:PKHD-type hydroxylase